MKRGRVLTHRPEAAPDRNVVFADAEVERAAAIRWAEEIIQIEARVARETEALNRLVREHQAERRRLLEAVPPEVWTEARRNTATRPTQPPPRPAFSLDALVAERDRREEERQEAPPSPTIPPAAELTAQVVEERAHSAIEAAAADLAADQPAGLPWRDVRRRVEEEGGLDERRYVGIVELTADRLTPFDTDQLRLDLERRIVEHAWHVASQAPQGAPLCGGPKARENAVNMAVRAVQDAADQIVDQALGRAPAERQTARPATAEPPATPGRAETPAAGTSSSPPPPPSPAAAGTPPPKTPGEPVSGRWKRFTNRFAGWLRTEAPAEPPPPTEVRAAAAAEPASTPAPTPRCPPTSSRWSRAAKAGRPAGDRGPGGSPNRTAGVERARSRLSPRPACPPPDPGRGRPVSRGTTSSS